MKKSIFSHSLAAYCRCGSLGNWCTRSAAPGTTGISASCSGNWPGQAHPTTPTTLRLRLFFGILLLVSVQVSLLLLLMLSFSHAIVSFLCSLSLVPSVSHTFVHFLLCSLKAFFFHTCALFLLDSLTLYLSLSLPISSNLSHSRSGFISPCFSLPLSVCLPLWPPPLLSREVLRVRREGPALGQRTGEQRPTCCLVCIQPRNTDWSREL